MSPAAYPTRHPLGLPAGSVRALLALMITGLFAVLVALPANRTVELPLFLYFLLTLLMVFVASHGSSIGVPGDAHPFGMPRGTFRFLVLAMIVAALAWTGYADRELLLRRVTPTPEQLKQWPTLCIALFGGFFVGRLLRWGPWRQTVMFQDIFATLSLLCMLGLLAETLLLLFVIPSLPQGLDLRMIETALTAMVSLYFGARS